MRRGVVKRREYGVVQIIDGPHAGIVGYYDNDDADGNALVALGAPTLAEVIPIALHNLCSATPNQKIDFEIVYLAELEPDLRARLGI